MAEIGKSEGFSKVHDLIDQYRKFCFDAAAKLKYDQVPRWVAFADNRMDDALKDGRRIMDSIKDAYVISIVTILLAAVSFWYLVLLYGAIAAGVVALTSLVSLPFLLLIIVAAILATLILIPVGYLLGAGLLHLCAKVLGGRGAYAQTLSVYVMAGAAEIILLIPLYILYAVFIGWILSPLTYLVIFYMYYLMYRGVRHVHGLNRNQGIAAVILFIASIIGIIVAFYLLFLFFFGGVGALSSFS
jgi:hypothetical protein